MWCHSISCSVYWCSHCCLHCGSHRSCDRPQPPPAFPDLSLPLRYRATRVHFTEPFYTVRTTPESNNLLRSEENPSMKPLRCRFADKVARQYICDSKCLLRSTAICAHNGLQMVCGRRSEIGAYNTFSNFLLSCE